MRSSVGLTSGSPTFLALAGGRSSTLKILVLAAVLAAVMVPVPAQGVTIAVVPPRWIPGGGVVVHG